jgi:hypothetical protein
VGGAKRSGLVELPISQAGRRHANGSSRGFGLRFIRASVSRIPLRIEDVGRKLYLSETPSIGWEAKTLGAKRRISSSEIATVPGALDLVQLLFSAVPMLVDWLVGSLEPQERGEAL